MFVALGVSGAQVFSPARPRGAERESKGNSTLRLAAKLFQVFCLNWILSVALCSCGEPRFSAGAGRAELVPQDLRNLETSET